VNGMAWQIYKELMTDDTAERYRKASQNNIRAIAESLPAEEPLLPPEEPRLHAAPFAPQ